MAKEFSPLRLFDKVERKFGDFDFESWVKRNKIRERARESGKIEHPPTKHAAKDEFPSKILAWVQGEATNCRSAVADTLGALETSMKEKVDSVVLEEQLGNCESINKESRIEIEKIASMKTASLERPKRDFEESKQELAEFKDQNKLYRVADFSHRKNAVLWISGCAFIEILLNAGLLMEVSESGLLGSFFVMVLIASVNILTGACIMGPVLRLINHVKMSFKTMGVIASIIVFMVICAWNFFVGHFRDELWALQEAIASLPEDATFQELMAVGGAGAIERIQESPFGLDSFHSFLLVINGLTFFAIAMVKGYQYDDAYPGYGKKTRSNQKIEENFLSSCRETVDQLERIYRVAKKKLEETRMKLSHSQSLYNHHRTSGNRILESYGTKFKQYEDVLQAALNVYYDSNTAERQSPPPDWPRLTLNKELFVEPSFSPPDDEGLENNMHKVQELLDSLMECYERVSQDFATGKLQGVSLTTSP